MGYPEQYRAEVLNAIQGLDLEGVSGAIDIFRDVRAHGATIFVCGTGSNASAAGKLLAEMVRGSNLNRAMRFRIVALSDELSHTRGLPVMRLRTGSFSISSRTRPSTAT